MMIVGNLEGCGMISQESKSVIERAKLIYQERLRANLERDNYGQYVSIEPDSGEYFLGESFDQAVDAALERFPDRLSHTIRVGHTAAFHLGVLELV